MHPLPSPRPGLAREHGAGKSLRRRRSRKQIALHQMDPELAHGDEVDAVLHALGDRTRAHAIGEVDDGPARRRLGTIVRATCYETAIELQLHEWKVVKLREREPFVAHVL